MADLNVLLTPFKIRHLTLRNRIISTSHAPAYAEEGMPKDRYQLYHEEKAKGGVAMTMFGGSSVISPECPASFGQLDFSTDRILPYLTEFSGRIKQHGAAIMCQISHTGRRSRWDTGGWLPNISASVVREPEHRSFPKAMEDWDFRRVVRDFGRAAKYCKDGGLDGVELSFNGMHLVPQFWTPLVNKRTDEYGGILENRLRFSLEVMDEVRKQVGDDYIVGIRLSGDELIKGGVDQEESVEIVKRLAATGQVDFFNVMGGVPNDYLNLAVQIGNMSFPVAPFLYLASRLKNETDVPIIQAQGISDLNTAARAVQDGHLDLVGMVRPQMSDPHMVRKLMEGRVDDVRQCVGANYCIDRIYIGGEALCIQSPATGREALMPHVIEKAEETKKVVVIGGGPAGLEAARVSAERGHEVTLFEKSAELGGQVNIARKATWREGLSGIPRWLETQVEKLGVDIKLNTEATVDVIRDMKPDYVVVATGGRPNKGFNDEHDIAVSSWDILTGKVSCGENVLFFDDSGGHQGPSCSEYLIKNGAQVEYVTPERSLGVEMGATNHPIHLRHLYDADTVMTPDTRLIGAYMEGNQTIAVLRNEYTLKEEERVVDQIVSEHGTLPVDDLYFELRPHSSNFGEVDLDQLVAGKMQPVTNNETGDFVLFRIGDAVSARNIHAAIYDGLRYCKDI